MKNIKKFNDNIKRKNYIDQNFVSPYLYLETTNKTLKYLEKYERLEYISSTQTGGQYINLGCKLLKDTDDIHIDIKFNIKGNGKNTSKQGALLGNQSPNGSYSGFVIRCINSNVEGFAKWQSSETTNNISGRYYHTELAAKTSNYRETIINQVYNISWTLDNIPNDQLNSTLNTCLFCNALLDGSNSPTNFSESDLYFLKIRKGDLYLNLIPVRKKSTNEVGLYDIENNKFYTSQGSEPFVGHEYSNIYENLYRKVEWVGSTYKECQHIDLGSKLMETTEDIQIDIKFKFLGKGNDANAEATLLKLNLEDGKTWPGVVLRRTKSNSNDCMEFQAKHNFTGSYTTDNTKYYYLFNNGTTRYPTYSSVIFEESILVDNIPVSQCHSATTYLFSSYDDEKKNPYKYAYANIYYLKLYKGGILVHDLIPVARLKDETPGLYDRVSKRFYRSNSNKHLLEGPDIIS